MRKGLKRVVFYFMLILAWEFIARLHFWPEYLFPSPIGVLKVFRDTFVDQAFLYNILMSLNRLVVGYAISLALGVFVGLSLYKWKSVDETVGTLILGLQTLPSICWLPLALLWFGLSETAILFVVVMGAFFPIAMATESSIKNIDPIYFKSGRNMGAHGFYLLVNIIFPAMLPQFVVGLRQGWSFAWRSLVAGELLYVTAGLGHLMNIGRELNDVNLVVAVMLIIMGISILVDILIFNTINKSVRRKWGMVGKTQ